MAQATLTRPCLEVVGHHMSVGKYLAQYRPDCRVATLVVAVDSAEDRISAREFLLVSFSTGGLMKVGGD